MKNDRQYAREILLGLVMCGLKEDSDRSLLLCSKPPNTNAGEFTRKEAWAVLIEAIKKDSLKIVVTDRGIWLSRCPEYLEEEGNSPVLVLKPSHTISKKRRCDDIR